MVKKIVFVPLKLMQNLNIKVINITNLVQVIFSGWFGYFEYVSYLQHGKMLIVLNQWSLSLITVNFNVYSSWSIIQWEIFGTKLHKPLLTQSVTALSPCPAQIILPFSCIFTFFEIIKHNMPKCCFFSFTFSIKMVTQKYNLDKAFLNYVLLQQLSQYNITKLFLKKLKITKHY